MSASKLCKTQRPQSRKRQKEPSVVIPTLATPATAATSRPARCGRPAPQSSMEVDKKKPVLPKGSALEGKEITFYQDQDGVRIMLVPSKEPNYYPLTITNDQLERLKAKAVVLSEKERLKIVEDARAEQARLENESVIRKNELKKFDKKGKMGGQGRLSALEREAKDKANYLLKRAWELRKEDEDDVKKANSLILQTKCQAIRDAQLVEHKLIEKELKEEELRIQRMMEDDRGRLFGDEKKRLEAEKAKREAYVRELNQQMEENEAHRLLEQEFQIEERRRATEAMFLIMLEDLEELRKKKEEKQKTREVLNLANEQIKRMKALEKEEERMADLRVEAYLKMKREREEKIEMEKEAERKRKDLEFARQREIHEKQSDMQAIQDEMNAIRHQEEYEKEWRRKEKEALMKKLKMEENCKLEREQQIRDNRRFQAMELAREKREYERNLKYQLEIQERERLLDLKRKHALEIYREQILKQINQKEMERIEERQEKFQEGLGLKAHEAKKISELQQYLENKIDVLRQHNVPEMYISQIKRHINIH